MTKKDWFSKVEERRKQALDPQKQEIRKRQKADEQVQRGKTALDRNRHTDALTAFNEALRLVRNFPDALFWRGTTYMALSDFEKAIADFNQMLKIETSAAVGYISRGIAHQLQGNDQLAEKDFADGFALNKLPLWQMLYNRALTYNTVREYDRALDDIASAIDAVPEDQAIPWQLYVQAGHIHMDQRRYPEAIEQYSQAIAINDQRPSLFMIRGHCKSRLGDNDAALIDIERAIELDPNDVTYRIQQGYLYGKRGERERAIATYDTLIAEHPHNAHAHNNRGFIFAWMGELEKSLADCDRALELDPTLWNGYSTRGHTRFLMGDYQEALNNFEHAHELQPTELGLRAEIALAKFALGEKDTALEIWREIMAEDDLYLDADAMQAEFDWADGFIDAAREVIQVAQE